MAKHASNETAADKGGPAHIGRHRERDAVVTDPQGFAVGRGVSAQDEFKRS